MDPKEYIKSIYVAAQYLQVWVDRIDPDTLADMVPLLRLVDDKLAEAVDDAKDSIANDGR